MCANLNCQKTQVFEHSSMKWMTYYVCEWTPTMLQQQRSRQSVPTKLSLKDHRQNGGYFGSDISRLHASPIVPDFQETIRLRWQQILNIHKILVGRVHLLFIYPVGPIDIALWLRSLHGSQSFLQNAPSQIPQHCQLQNRHHGHRPRPGIRQFGSRKQFFSEIFEIKIVITSVFGTMTFKWRQSSLCVLGFFSSRKNLWNGKQAGPITVASRIPSQDFGGTGF